MRELTRGGTAEPISRDQFFSANVDREKEHFSCSADHVNRIGNHARVDPTGHARFRMANQWLNYALPLGVQRKVVVQVTPDHPSRVGDIWGKRKYL